MFTLDLRPTGSLYKWTAASTDRARGGEHARGHPRPNVQQEERGRAQAQPPVLIMLKAWDDQPVTGATHIR